MAGGLLLLSRSRRSEGAGKAGCPSAPSSLVRKKTGRRRTSFHSPQGSTAIRFSLQRETWVAPHVHRIPARLRSDRDAPLLRAGTIRDITLEDRTLQAKSLRQV